MASTRLRHEHRPTASPSPPERQRHRCWSGHVRLEVDRWPIRRATALPSQAESVREDLFAAIVTQVGRPRFGAKGVGITYPFAKQVGRPWYWAKGVGITHW